MTRLLLVIKALLLLFVASSAQQTQVSGYAPRYVDCPDNVQWIRSASGLSKQERDWVKGRKQVVQPAMIEYLQRLNIPGFDLNAYAQALSKDDSAIPTLGMAISGGGWASSFTGTGMLRAMDNRLPEANQQRTGGLLQSMTYFSGLSGGSFPTLSFAAYNFPTADEIVTLWNPAVSRFPTTNTSTAYTESTNQIFQEMADKRNAGFNISIADYLGRAFADEFLPGPYGGINVTMSGLTQQPKFLSYEMPMSIIQLTEVGDWDQEYAGLRIPSFNNTMYEVTPFEFGAWSGSVSSFMPTKYVGTTMNNGSPANMSACVVDFDKASFVIGSTADAFNLWYIEALTNNTLGEFSKRQLKHIKRSSLAKRTPASPAAEFQPLIDAFNQTFGLNLTSITYAVWPNAFAGLSSSSPAVQTAKDLRLLDGSTSGQAIPFWGQLHRNVDFIMAWEANEDAEPYSWNNGTNMYNTYLAANASGLPFPTVPPAATMMNYNYTTLPHFFGCDINLTTTKSADSPIVMWLPNAPYSAYTNYSYVQTSISRRQVYDIFENSFNELTRGNGSVQTDQDWPVCIGCAAIDRSLGRLGIPRPRQCEKCFAAYCWDGTYNNTRPAPMDPALLLYPDVTFAMWNATHPF